MAKKSGKGREKRKLKFTRRHLHVVAILLAFIAAAATFLFLYHQQTNKEVEATNQATQKMISDADAELKKIEERKAAEEKARQEAAAKEAAEQAKTADESTASTIDSSSCNTSKVHNNPASIDVLVNKKHCIQPVAFAPTDLQTMNGATLSAKAMDAYNQMFSAAAAAGQGFSTTSSYRSYANQVSTYNYWVSMSGQAGADTYSARPGYSEHQTGLVIDVAANGCALDCFGSTTQYQWFQ